MLALALVVALSFAPQDQGDPVAAARAAVGAAEQQHGSDSLEAAEALVRLYNQLSARGLAEEALAVASRVVAIREAKLPPTHARLGIAVANLASAHMMQRRPEVALPLLERARAILAQSAPSRAMLGVLANLGACRIQLADYVEARRWLDEAVAYGRQHAPEHPMLAQALQLRACALLNLGEVDEARRLVEETVAVLARAEPDGRRHAHALLSLGFVLLQAERYDEAEPLLRRALELRREHFGVDHIEVGVVEMALASLHRARRDLVTARQLAESAVRKPAGTMRRFEVFGWQAQLSHIIALQGDVAAALAVSTAAVDAARAAGARDKDIHVALVNHGDLLAKTGRDEDAIEVLQRALVVSAELGLDTSLAVNASRSALATSLWRTGDTDGAIANLTANLRTFDRLLDRTLPALSQVERLRLVAEHRDDLDRLLQWTRERPACMPVEEVWGCLLTWKGQVGRGVLARQMAARADAEGLARMRRLAEITAAVSMGRADAAMLVERQHLVDALHRSHPDRVPVTPAEVMARLGQDGALLDCVATSAGGEARYEVFVVRRDGVRRIDLGAAGPIGKAVRTHLDLLARSTRSGAAAVAEPVARDLRRRVFEPLLPALGGAGELLISPDHVLATLPFETLPDVASGTFLLERLAISYLQDATDLVRPVAPTAPTRLLVCGDIDYGAAAGDGTALRGAPRPFVPLPATGRELDDCVAAAPGVACTVLRGRTATEAKLRDSVGGATHVHLATHGFCGTGDEVAAEHAGIALAGANLAAERDDGILGGEEASLLDLRSCRLIVLSACQTGLGKPFAGESLLGLRRSLRLAGARTTITSLWRVADAATAALMADFYRELFGRGRDPAAALRAAQLAALRRAREATGEGLPGTWGAFVSEGR